MDLANLIDKLPPLKIPGLHSTDSIGIDLGTYSVKIVQLKKQAGNLHLVRWSVIPLLGGGETEKAELTPEEKKAQMVNLLKIYRGSGKKIPTNVVTSVSGNSVIVRYVKFNKLTRKELSKAIKAEAEPYIPFNVEEVYIGFHLLRDIIEDGKAKMETVLVAAKKDFVGQRLEILEEAGFKPMIIDVDAFALESSYETFNPTPAASVEAAVLDTGTVLLANVGYTKTNFSVLENGISTLVKDTPIAGQSITKYISKTLGVDSKNAEKLKLACGILLRNEDKEVALAADQKEALGVSEAAMILVKDLAQEIRKIMQYYTTQGKEKNISKILISGGSANIKNFPAALASDLNLPVEFLNPFQKISGCEGIPEEYQMSLTIAAGLAMRRLGDVKD